MSDSFRALASDFYVNQKVTVKMELPRTRETVLEMFDRTRRQYPAMNIFRRVREELSLESPQTDTPHRWMVVRPTSIRTGTVNPPTMGEAYAIHQYVLETSPHYLSISPLDIECIELLYGFDLLARGNHDAIVLDALMAGSPLSALLDIPGASPIECQPAIGLSLGQRGDIEAYFEVRTRPAHAPAREGDPISVYLTMKKYGPFDSIKQLPEIFGRMTMQGEELVEKRLVPGLLVPIREAIASGNV